MLLYNLIIITHYIPHKETLNLQRLSFPMHTKLIHHFEQNNPSISINILYADEDTRNFSIEYVSPHRNRTHHINILICCYHPTANVHQSTTSQIFWHMRKTQTLLVFVYTAEMPGGRPDGGKVQSVAQGQIKTNPQIKLECCGRGRSAVPAVCW